MKKIAIVSGKGGTGKSSVTAALVQIAQHAMAIDCDVDAANLHLIYDTQVERTETYYAGKRPVIDAEKCILCGLCVDHCHFKALSQQEDQIIVDEVACESCGLCKRICPENAISTVDSAPSYMYFGPYKYGYMAHARLTPGEDNSGKLVSDLREIADEIAEEKGYDLQILDGPPGIGCPVIATLTGMDEIVLVTEPSKSGLSDLKRIHELSLRFSKRMLLIINKWDMAPSMSKVIEEWADNQEISVYKLPFDKRMLQAVLNKQSIVEYAPKSEISITLQTLFKCFN